MKLTTFKRGYKNGWEVNFIGKVLNIRFARHQFAIWWNLSRIVGFTF